MSGTCLEADVSGSVLMTRNEVHKMLGDINAELERLSKAEEQLTGLREKLIEQKRELISILADHDKTMRGDR